MSTHVRFGIAGFAFGFALVVLVAIAAVCGKVDHENAKLMGILAMVGCILILVSGGWAMGQRLKGFKISGIGDIVFEPTGMPPTSSKPANVKPEASPQQQEQIERSGVPGSDAPSWNVLHPPADMGSVPGADPVVPMYMLDPFFRLVDWNDAFSIAFDHTMEGRRGQNIVGWVYFLKNFEKVVAHGREAFGDPNMLPLYDEEEVRYESSRFGEVVARKMAYCMPDIPERGGCKGWLVVLNPQFADASTARRFERVVLRAISRRMIWSEYALSYDRVLTKTIVYPELLREIAGEMGRKGVLPIPANAVVLDLGAGTGNLSRKLLTEHPTRLVVAIENNPTMIRILEHKCVQWMRTDASGPGVMPVRQDVNSLYGIEDEFFDVVMANNVIYSLDDPIPCLKDIRRVLKPGGEVRITGPKKDTNLAKLFKRIKKDLVEAKVYQDLAADFEDVQRINELNLSTMLYRWNVSDVERMVREAGLEPTCAYDDVYAGQAMLVCARKLE